MFSLALSVLYVLTGAQRTLVMRVGTQRLPVRAPQCVRRREHFARYESRRERARIRPSPQHTPAR